MVNLPATIWQTTDGLGESVGTGVFDIVDTLLNKLVDPSGNQIVDTGVEMQTIPATVWAENNGV